VSFGIQRPQFICRSKAQLVAWSWDA